MSHVADKILDDAGARPYRELIEHHLRRQSEKQLQVASLGGREIARLPSNMRPRAEVFIDMVNHAVGFDAQFWATATSRDAYERFVKGEFS